MMTITVYKKHPVVLPKMGQVRRILVPGLRLLPVLYVLKLDHKTNKAPHRKTLTKTRVTE